MTVKIYKHKFIPNLSVIVHNKKKAENKTKKPIKVEKKVKTNIPTQKLEKRKCILCENKYKIEGNYSKPYCENHKPKEVMRITFIPNEKKK